jgi:hypothetical protein
MNQEEDMKDEIRSLTRDLIEALLRDEWPSNAACVDFGILSPAHLGALQYAVIQDGVTAEKLDAALGKGAELQKLIGPGNRYRYVTFCTDWDDMPGEPEEFYVAVHESRVTGVWSRIERRRYFPGASVDQIAPSKLGKGG